MGSLSDWLERNVIDRILTQPGTERPEARAFALAFDPDPYGLKGPVLKGCPFCGRPDLIITEKVRAAADPCATAAGPHGFILWQVECSGCGAAGPIGHDMLTACELWNQATEAVALIGGS